MSDIQAGPNARPRVQWNHEDGPLMTCSDGTLHWLTLWERLGLRAGFITLEMLDRQHNSQPTQA